jgi:peptide/nickel transport system ATP-binding protein
MSDAVRGVTLTLGQEKLGVVGESGSGKSPTARAILRLLPDSAVITADKLSFDDIDVMIANEAALRAIRGKRAGLILQDPKFSLNPVMTAGAQIAEAWRAHRAGTQSGAPGGDRPVGAGADPRARAGGRHLSARAVRRPP